MKSTTNRLPKLHALGIQATFIKTNQKERPIPKQDRKLTNFPTKRTGIRPLFSVEVESRCCTRRMDQGPYLIKEMWRCPKRLSTSRATNSTATTTAMMQTEKAAA